MSNSVFNHTHERAKLDSTRSCYNYKFNLRATLKQYGYSLQLRKLEHNKLNRVFIRNEKYLKMKQFLIRLWHSTTLYLSDIEFDIFLIRFCRSASLKTHISVSLTNRFGILSIPVTSYNRAMAQFGRGNIPALIFIIRSQSELKSLNFFVLTEEAF